MTFTQFGNTQFGNTMRNKKSFFIHRACLSGCGGETSHSFFDTTKGTPPRRTSVESRKTPRKGDGQTKHRAGFDLVFYYFNSFSQTVPVIGGAGDVHASLALLELLLVADARGALGPPVVLGGHLAGGAVAAKTKTDDFVLIGLGDVGRAEKDL